MRHASRQIVAVAAFAIVHVEGRRHLGVFQRAVQQVDLLLGLTDQAMPKMMTQHQRAHGANRIGEQGMRPVEGIDVTPAGDGSLIAHRLHRA